MAKKGMSLEERIKANINKIESANTNNGINVETENNSSANDEIITNTETNSNVNTKTEISDTDNTEISTKNNANTNTNTDTSSSTNFILKKKPKEPKEEHVSTYLRSDQVEYRKSLTKLGYNLKEIDQMIYDFAKENMRIER